MRNIILLICWVLILTVSCRKDIDTLEESYEFPLIKEYVNTTIVGSIIDENDNPISDATVFIGSKSVKTDLNGIFQIKNLVVESKNTTVRVIKSGYFPGFRTLNVSNNTRNTISIKLLVTNTINNIQSSTGGLISFNDYSIEIPANSIVYDDGSPYNGTVRVKSKWLDPTDKEFGVKMPGRLMGLSTTGTLNALISMGMLAVELSSSSGDLLVLKKGSEATIRMKVPASLLSSASQIIPLWYYHPIKGIWIEEGSANLVNGFYEGKVKHFSFWNCDLPREYIDLTFKIHDKDGNPMKNVKVTLQLTSGGQICTGWTNSNGEVNGFVPKNEILNQVVYTPFGSCAIPELTQQIGPFAVDKTITLVFISSSIKLYKLFGDLKNCTNEAVTSGYIKISGGLNIIAWADDLGHVDETILICTPLNSKIDITAFDTQTTKVSNSKSVYLSNINEFNAGNLQLCSNATEYLTYTFNGTTYSYFAPKFYLTSPSIHVVMTGGGNDLNIQFNFLNPSNTTGHFEFGYFQVSGKDKQGNSVKQYCNVSCDSIYTDVLENDWPGGYILGNFTGTAIDSSIKSNVKVIPVSGTFRGKWN